MYKYGSFLLKKTFLWYYVSNHTFILVFHILYAYTCMCMHITVVYIVYSPEEVL